MDNDLISRSALIEGHVSNDPVVIAALHAPTVDAAPVVHGRWEAVKRFGNTTLYRCTSCKTEMIDYSGREVYHRYCHRCGARMDGGEDDG